MMDRGVLIDLRAAEDRVAELEEALGELRRIIEHVTKPPRITVRDPEHRPRKQADRGGLPGLGSYPLPQDSRADGDSVKVDS